MGIIMMRGRGNPLVLLRKTLDLVARVFRQKASGALEFELKELENIFMLLLLGSFVGIPSPPAALAFELLPHLEEELRLMMSRADMAQDPLGALFAALGVD